ncbi:RDD family protein [Lysobacter panacisoli]|uniref:RDD family protein n=1 Tax=Lysobacter panacisoli TaxID=1255263 RepID=A0ABP9L2C0_9GAMM|nr:RDD family protein [Lysobacter panacisoli]
MTEWYYHLPGQGRVGPMAADDVRTAYRDGQVQRDTLAWHSGARDWQPLDRFSEELELDGIQPARRAPEPPAIPASPAYAATAGASAAQASVYAASTAYAEPSSPYAPPRASVSDTGTYAALDASDVVYAGFWRRVAALVIDAIVVSIAYYIVMIVMFIFVGAAAFGAIGSNNAGAAAGPIMAMFAVIYLAYPVISGLYYIGFESSTAQATLGKMAVGIKVADADGRRLSRMHAFGRWASHLLCYFTLYIGYVMAAFTERKRGLHDMVASTLVVDRWAYTSRPDRQQRGLGTVAIVVLVLGALLAVAYVGLMMAVAIPAYQDYLQRAAAASAG